MTVNDFIYWIGHQPAWYLFAVFIAYKAVGIALAIVGGVIEGFRI